MKCISTTGMAKISRTWQRAAEIMATSIFSCLLGGSFYTYGIYSLGIKADAQLNQLETNVLGGLLLMTGNFLSLICMRTFDAYPRTTSLLPCLFGSLAFALLAWIDFNHASFPALCVIISRIGLSIFGGFLATFKAVTTYEPSKLCHVNVLTAMNQSMYALGNILWPIVYYYVFDSNWKHFCAALCVGNFICAVLGAMFYYQTESSFVLSVNADYQQEVAVAEHTHCTTASTTASTTAAALDARKDGAGSDLGHVFHMVWIGYIAHA